MGLDFDIRAAAHSERDASGFIKVQPRFYGEDGGGMAYQLLAPVGFFCRPLEPSPPADDETGSPDEGVGGDVLVALHGAEGFAMPLQDLRMVPLLPDPGLGGSGIAGAGGSAAALLASYIRVAGLDVDGVTAGTVTIHVPYAAGAMQHTVEIEPGGDITITHGTTGVKLVLTAAAVLLGSDLAVAPVMIDSGSVTSFFSNIIAAFAGLGVTVSPPAGYLATKVKAL